VIAIIEVLDAGIAAVVASVKVTAEFSLPEPTCDGLNPQVVSAGSFEHEKLTFFGKDPAVGLTSRVKTAGCPAGCDALAGLTLMVKSKVWLGSALKATGAEWEIAAESFPIAVILKL
jgi:hypothetical protein